jgi:hypothetical protein
VKACFEDKAIAVILIQKDDLRESSIQNVVFSVSPSKL